ncbi:hypothetical protein [Vibrio parahaemolyticus]|uniref:hypothetical protein n=1 Tax=Vibrio parahaemolyticus TaxID=670 RepID=UPI001F50E6B8|nr:hypothetical protein [Vibrio parahaemolyticus]WOZ60689.1 hypothetical protein RHS38_07525 [Vibrio parahaemolyticus]
MTLFFEQLKKNTAAAQQAMLTAPVIADVQQGNISKDMYIAFLEGVKSKLTKLLFLRESQ